MEQNKLNYARIYMDGNCIKEGYFTKRMHDGCMADITFNDGDRYRVHAVWVILEHRDL